MPTKTKRRKAVPCAICEIETTMHDNGVCGKCMGIYRAGRDALALRAAKGEGEFEVIQMPNGLRLHGERVPLLERMAKESPLLNRIGQLILDVAGAVPAHSWADPIQIDYAHQQYTYGGAAYAVAPGRAKLIEELVQAISAYVGMREAKAFDEGNSILMRLASGDVGLAEANEYTKNQSGQGKGR